MKAKTGFTLRPLGREFILTADNIQQVNFNKMISLNESAAFLWRSVQGMTFTADTLADLLVGQYGIDRERALADSENIMGKWKEAEIVEE
ncbi:MAG: PqqD family peptide modification chaperone [Bacteroidales bacterium]|nr:PqqD family peptide modification chaperone [Bacteroidales bacterium]